MIDTSRVIPFVSRTEWTASVNVQNFITHMKRCFVGTEQEWSAVRWPGVGFSKLGCKRISIPSHMAMDADFMDFAKAYLLHRRVLDPRANISQHGIMFRSLEAALVKAHACGKIHLCIIADLDEAAQIAQAHYSRDTAYGAGVYLTQMAEFLYNHLMCGQNLSGWMNPQPRPLDTVKTTSKEGEEARSKRLPGEAELDAIAEIFASNPSDPKDIFTSSAFALLMCAPSRANEIIALRADAEVEETDREGVSRYGWRFYSSKNFAGDIKWIPSSMVDIAKTAFHRMLDLSRPARALAAWMEECPNEFYRHKLCPNVADDNPLSVFELTEALGKVFPDRQSAGNFARIRKLNAEDGAYTLNGLWRHLYVNKLPPGFPWFDEKKGVKYSNCIFSVLENQLHAKRHTTSVILQKVNVSTLWSDLGPRCTVKNHRSVFDRYGFVHPSGESYKLTTHQPRHLLNTIAQRGGMSNLALAKWSGRANVSTNQVYNHVSDTEVFEKLRLIRTPEQGNSPVKLLHEIHAPIESDDVLIYRDGAAHVTEFGYCVHNFVISPCTKFRDCINCTEQVCLKGHEQNRNRLVGRLEKLERILALAKQGEGLDEYGADKWVTHHVTTIARIRSLLALMDNPEIAEGALVKLRGKDFSQLSRVFNRISSEDGTEVDESSWPSI
ncbi:integrase [Pseudomonas protegens]|uniref:integrase n=1 Tax=Pseudomonas protegens TaxID=380021 RepID=UPI00380C41FD